MTVRILTGHVLDRLVELPGESVHCCVTSPPYYGLRDYGIEPVVWGGEPGCEHEWRDEQISAANDSNRGSMEWTTGGNPAAKVLGQRVSQGAFCRRCAAWRGSLGLEPTPALYVEHMVAVFRAVRRVLRRDGTLWLNIGDAYFGSTTSVSNWDSAHRVKRGIGMPEAAVRSSKGSSLKPKDLIGIPWMLAFALRDDGWYLRSEITWAKRAPMPESVTDRPTSATEKVFLLTRSPRYFYDAEAVKEEAEEREPHGIQHKQLAMGRSMAATTLGYANGKRNMRNWWLLGTEPFAEAHFATFPSEIPRRAILAGTSAKGVCPTCGAPWQRIVETAQRQLQVTNNPGKQDLVSGWDRTKWPRTKREDETIGWQPSCRCAAGDPVPATVLDPFLGAGTTGLVADQLQRDCIGIELNPSYAAMAERRIYDDAPLFAHVEVRLSAANLLMSGGGLAPVSHSNGLDLETMQLSKPNSTIDLEG